MSVSRVRCGAEIKSLACDDVDAAVSATVTMQDDPDVSWSWWQPFPFMSIRLEGDIGWTMHLP